MTKLTETQTVIITKALANDRFVLSHEKSGSKTDPRAYGSAIASLIKQGFAILTALPFNVRDGHYVKDSCRVRITDTGIAALDDLHEGSAKAKPARVDVDVYTTEGDVVKLSVSVAKAAKTMGLDETELLWALEDAGRCDTDEYVAVMAETGFPVDADEVEEIEEEDDRPGSIVGVGYKAYYASLKAQGGSGTDNNDELARWFKSEFTGVFVDEKGKKRQGLDVASLWVFCEENGIRWNGYLGLNNGQKSMNVRNVVRGMIKNGKDIFRNGKLVFKGKEEATAEAA